jgi:hypothetical protein
MSNADAPRPLQLFHITHHSHHCSATEETAPALTPLLAVDGSFHGAFGDRRGDSITGSRQIWGEVMVVVGGCPRLLGGVFAIPALNPFGDHSTASAQIRFDFVA